MTEERSIKSRTQKNKSEATSANTQPKKKKTNKKENKRGFVLLFIALAFITFIIGSMVGYGVLGDKNALEVFDIDTWIHMYALIFG